METNYYSSTCKQRTALALTFPLEFIVIIIISSPRPNDTAMGEILMQIICHNPRFILRETSAMALHSEAEIRDDFSDECNRVHSGT